MKLQYLLAILLTCFSLEGFARKRAKKSKPKIEMTEIQREPIFNDFGSPINHIIDDQSLKKVQKKPFINNIIEDISDISKFRVSIDMEKSSVKNFFRNIYNDSNYAQSYLAFNFSHLKDFLKSNKKCKKPKNYVKSCLKLFNQKIKSASFINPYAFSDMLDDLSDNLSELFIKDDKTIKKEAIKNCIYDFFDYDFDDLPEDTEGTIEKFSEKLFQITIEGDALDITSIDLQCTIHQFLETCINKLIWSTKNEMGSWELFKYISKQFEKLYDQKIVADIDALDELFWSLISRFSYFLKLSGPNLSEFFYDKLESEIETEEISIFTLEEKEELITTKKDHLKRMINLSRLRARAIEKNLIPYSLN